MICTFPGRYGDILWSLPTVRALSEKLGEPVTFYIGGEFKGLIPLLLQQPYIRAVEALPNWGLTPPEEWIAPLVLSSDVEELVHLGYRGWPHLPLPYFIAEQAGVEIQLDRPWITVAGSAPSCTIAVGFTEAWFELKFGLLSTFNPDHGDPTMLLLTIPGSRWMTEARYTIRLACDCSALHVLACAMGKKVILMEPMEGRWNPIFYPYGMDGPQVTVVKGNDGRPTFDSRHCADTLRKALSHV